MTAIFFKNNTKKFLSFYTFIHKKIQLTFSQKFLSSKGIVAQPNPPRFGFVKYLRSFNSTFCTKAPQVWQPNTVKVSKLKTKRIMRLLFSLQLYEKKLFCSHFILFLFYFSGCCQRLLGPRLIEQPGRSAEIFPSKIFEHPSNQS